MDIGNFINHIAAGENVEAKETLEGLLSSKAFDALQVHKQEMAKTIFGGKDDAEQVEGESTEEVTEQE